MAKNGTKPAAKKRGAADAKDVADSIRFLPQSYVADYPVRKLKEFPGNPKEHDIGAIAESMKSSGFAGVILAQKSTGRIISGHGTRETARQEGAETVPVVLVDCDDKTARKLLLAFNRIPELGGYRDDLLVSMLQGLGEGGADALRGTGWDGDDVDALLKKISAPPAFPSVDESIPTEHQCPKCGYEWSGPSKPKG